MIEPLPQLLGALLLSFATLLSVNGSAAEPANGSTALAAAPALVSVNINRADADAIAAALQGVGPSRARAIVAYREANGPFERVESLVEVRGVSAAIVDRNRARIVLED